jgi:peptidoglycan hydrolase-like protein with peptidoglycan-binding domain
MLALLLVAALTGYAAAQQAAGGDMGQGAMQQPGMTQPPMAAPAGRGGVASGVQCDKKCIMDVQRKLKEEGMYQGTPDGKPGPKTMAAVKKFQTQKGISASGMIDEQTLSALNVQPSGRGGAAAPKPLMDGGGAAQEQQPPMGGGVMGAPSGSQGGGM